MNDESMTKKERRMQRREEKQRKQEVSGKFSFIKQWGITAVVILGVGGGLYWWWYLGPRPSAEAFDPTKVCTSDPRTVLHLHPHLAIVFDGTPQTIPSQVGITPSCLRPIHTHDDTGKIHVESPVERDFTLGEFFKVWGKPFDKDHILDKTLDAQHRIVMLVDGKDAQDYEKLILKDNQQIEIRYEKITQ